MSDYTKQAIGNFNVQNDSKSAIRFNTEMTHIQNYIAALLNFTDKDKKKNANMIDALQNHSLYANQKILELATLGLSIANGDYYIIPYCGKPKFELDYKGMLKICSQEAKERGFQLIVKADTLRDGFTRADVITDGMLDSIKVENGKINSPIVSAFAIIALLDIKTRDIIMQKVEIFPLSEYLKVKNSTKSKDKQGNIFGVWLDYESEMAKKAILRRTIKVFNTMFSSDVIDKLLSFDNENYEELENIKEENKILKEKVKELSSIERDLLKNINVEKVGEN